MSHAPDEATTEDRIAALRASAVVESHRRLWLAAGAATLVALAAAIVVVLLAAGADNARIQRLQSAGLPVTVTVTDCRGNLGGSGSNIVDYVCHGNYTVAGTSFHEVIGSMGSAAAVGATVRGVVDPRQHSTVVLASSVSSMTTSSRAYVVAGALALLLIVLALGLVRMARRTVSSSKED